MKSFVTIVPYAPLESWPFVYLQVIYCDSQCLLSFPEAFLTLELVLLTMGKKFLSTLTVICKYVHGLNGLLRLKPENTGIFVLDHIARKEIKI